MVEQLVETCPRCGGTKGGRGNARWRRPGSWNGPRAKSIGVTARGREQAGKAIVAVEDTDAAFFASLGERTAELVRHFAALVKSEAEKS